MRTRPSRMTDITGKKFGRLTAEWPAGIRERRVFWLCLCECGNLKVLCTSSLTQGKTKSCGCWHKEQTRKARTTHGHTACYSHTTTYGCWRNMHTRCENSNTHNYEYSYGGRGIKVCKRWDSFENFLADMGEKPKGLTIERINNDGDYEPSNCKWATKSEQAFNRRPKRKIR